MNNLDPVLCKRVYILNDEVDAYIDIFPSYAMVKFSDWRNAKRLEINREKLFFKLHLCCGLCYFDLNHTAKVELEPLYEVINDERERMVMIQFGKVVGDSDRAKVSFRELVEALSTWV